MLFNRIKMSEEMYIKKLDTFIAHVGLAIGH